MSRLLIYGFMMFAGVLPAVGQAPGNRSPLAENAALQYWQAFSQLPTQTEAHDKIFAELYTTPLGDPATAKLLDNSRASLLYLRRGGALGQCDWGLEYSDGISLLLPHLAKARDLSRLGALDARAAFERGDFGSARTTVQAMLVLGRHVRRDPIMISILVGIGIEDMAIDAAAPYLPDWKPTRRELQEMLQQLPAETRLASSIATEKSMAEGIVRQLSAAEAGQSWKELWKSLFTGTEVTPPEVASAAAAIALVEGLMPVYAELERFLVMPQAQFHVEYPAFKERTKAAQPLAGLLLPAIDQVRAKQQRHDARLAMLVAAAAVIESGPAALPKLEVLADVGPLEYRALGKGFELRAKTQFAEIPVTLAIGQRK